MKASGIDLKGYGIRIDSGDLAYLSKKAYEMLDAAGFGDAIISASSDLDEYLIYSLKTQADQLLGRWYQHDHLQRLPCLRRCVQTGCCEEFHG